MVCFIIVSGLIINSVLVEAQDKSKSSKSKINKTPDLVKKPVKAICNALPGKWRVSKVICGLSSTKIHEEGVKSKGPGVALKLTDKLHADPEKDYSVVELKFG